MQIRKLTEIIRGKQLDFVYTLVTTLFHGLRRNNITFSNLAPNLSVEVLLLQPLKSYGYNHCFQNFKFLNKRV